MHKNKLNLRNVVKIVICLAAMTMFSGCDKEQESTEKFKKEQEDTGKSNFYDIDYRIGLWINAERNDTLEFVSSSELIRKGGPSTYEEYLYRIENDILIISLPAYKGVETIHPILKAEKNKVHLNNMYGGVGFYDSQEFL